MRCAQALSGRLSALARRYGATVSKGVAEIAADESIYPAIALRDFIMRGGKTEWGACLCAMLYYEGAMEFRQLEFVSGRDRGIERNPGGRAHESASCHIQVLPASLEGSRVSTECC